MPIKIEITGDSQSDIDVLMKHFIKVDPYKCSLDDLLDITRKRFTEAGFAVTLEQQNPPLSSEDKPAPPAIEPASAEAAAAAIVGEIEAALAEPLKRKRGRPAAVKAEPEEESSNVVEMTQPSKPDEDQTYVLDELSKRFADPKQKNKTKAFIDRVAGRHGGVRLSRLEAKLFPAIKQEMEAYFTGGGNGHAA
jgi:type IV secretory pathway VirB10-like protein